MDLIREDIGIEATALIASLTSLIMKFAMALGEALPGFILSFSGYIANQPQSPSAIKGIMLVTFGVPLLLYLFTAILFYRGFAQQLRKKR